LRRKKVKSCGDHRRAASTAAPAAEALAAAVGISAAIAAAATATAAGAAPTATGAKAAATVLSRRKIGDNFNYIELRMENYLF